MEAARTTRGLLPALPVARGSRRRQAWPREPVRCPHCHLLIGAGRGQSEPCDEPGTKGTAAGVFSRQAKREGAEPSVSPAEVLAGIREAARQLGERPSAC